MNIALRLLHSILFAVLLLHNVDINSMDPDTLLMRILMLVSAIGVYCLLDSVARRREHRLYCVATKPASA